MTEATQWLIFISFGAVIFGSALLSIYRHREPVLPEAEVLRKISESISSSIASPAGQTEEPADLRKISELVALGRYQEARALLRARRRRLRELSQEHTEGGRSTGR